MEFERTITDSVSLSDRGLHNGKMSRMTLLPAPPGSGISFRRVDLPGNPEIRAGIESALGRDSRRRTVLKAPGGASVQTVEHLLSAAYAMGIDNLVVEVDSEELPFGDGSALPMAELIRKAGITTQDKKRRTLVIEHPVLYRDTSQGDISVAALPWDGFAVTFFIEYPGTFIGSQALHLMVTPEAYEKEIAPAQTYGFWEEIEPLRAQGLIKGGDLDRAIIIRENGYLNSEKVRFQDELVRHKILDLIGDLALLGHRLKGHIVGKKSGHRHHVEFVKLLKESA